MFRGARFEKRGFFCESVGVIIRDILRRARLREREEL